MDGLSRLKTATDASGMEVAVKIYDLSNMSTAERTMMLYSSEKQALSIASHSNLVRLVNSSDLSLMHEQGSQKRVACQVLEKVQGYELMEFVQ